MKYGKPTLWDYRAHLDLVEEINGLRIRGKPLSNAFVIDGFNAWHWYQGLLFESVKWRTIDGITPSLHTTSGRGFLRILFNTFCFTVLSLFGFIAAYSRKPKVFLYSIDLSATSFHGDQRILPVYEALGETKTPFIECFHAVTAKGALMQWIKRRRATLYLEGADFFFALRSMTKQGKELALLGEIDFSRIAEKDRILAKAVVMNLLERIELSRFRVRMLRRVFRALRTREFLAIDDPRYVWEMLAAAKAERIPSTLLQHGHYTRYHTGWRQFRESSTAYLSPDQLLVWSGYWERELEQIGSVFKKIVVAGYKNALPDVAGKGGTHDRLRILVPYEAVAPKERIGAFIRALLAEPRVQVFFKPRNDVPLVSQLAEYGITDPDGITMMPNLSKNPSDDIDLAVGTYTTLLSELIMYGVPVALLETPMDYGDGLTRNGIAGKLALEPEHSLFEHVEALAAISDIERARRRAVVAGEGGRRMADAIAEYLSAR